MTEAGTHSVFLSLPDTWRAYFAEMVMHPLFWPARNSIRATKAAAAGLGIAVVLRLFVEAELEAGTLIEPFAKRSRKVFTYMMY